MVLIIVLFKYGFYIFTIIKYLIVFGLPSKYPNTTVCPLFCLQNIKLKFVSSFITRHKDEIVYT